MTMFKCDKCDYVSTTFPGLRVHQTQKHEGLKPVPIQCKICGRSIGAHAFGLHIKRLHNMDIKMYYDAFKKKPNEGICINCGKPTRFITMTYGYAESCSQLCQKQHVWNNLSEEQKQEANKKNSESVKKYIQNRSKEETSVIMKKIHHSQTEDYIIKKIKTIYDGPILRNVKNKKFIYPNELDIVLPELNLAIEYNGMYWHSTLSKKPIDYHLNKSLLCREKNIRLIHIYEFEDLDMQIGLLLNLIEGKDEYSKKDFNKNNLIKKIPQPEIVYQNGRYIIYGAGKLYN